MDCRQKAALYCCFAVIGTCTTLAFNFFVNASEFYNYKFRNLTAVNTTSDLQVLFESYFSIATATASLVGAVLNVILTTRLTCLLRTTLGHGLVFVPLFVTAVMTKVSTDSWQITFFGLTMALLILANFGSSFIGGAVAGMAATLSGNCMNSLVFGQAFAGFGSAATDVITLSLEKNVTLSALLYFVVGSCLVLCSYASYLYIKHTVYVIEMDSKLINQSSQMFDADTQLFLANASTMDNSTNNAELEPDQVADTDVQKPCIITVVRKTLVYGSALTISWIVNSTLFPGVLARAMTAYPNTPWARYFTAVACFLAAGFGGSLGTTASWVLKWPKFGQKWLHLALAFGRISLLVLTLFCNIQPRHHLPVWISNDFVFMLIVVTISATNGHLMCLIAVYLPKTVEPSEAEIAGALLGVYILTGIFVGPPLSIAIMRLI